MSFVLPVLSTICAQSGRPVFSDSLFSSFKLKYNEGSYKESLVLYDSVPAEKLSAEESFYLGLSCNNLRDVYKASQFFLKAVEFAPGHKGYRVQLARTLSQLGRVNEAVQNYQTVIEIDSNYVTALSDLGLLYFEMREYQKAVMLFNRLVSINSNDFLSSYYLGNSMLFSANPNYAESALKHLEHSIAVNREYLPAINLLALSKFNLQKYYEANALYGMAIKLRPQNAEYLFKSGMCYERLKFFPESSILYNRAIALDSNQADYFDHLGFVYFNLNRYDSAAKAYTNAISIDDNPVYFINLGFTYAKMDSAERSIESFQNALSRMQIDKIGGVYNQIGAVYYSKKNYKEAKSAYEKALIYYPGNTDAQFYIAMINEKLMDWKNALSAYRKVIKLAEGDSSQTERIEYSNKKIDVLKKIR
jgi:superkiller protein 3